MSSDKGYGKAQLSPDRRVNNRARANTGSSEGSIDDDEETMDISPQQRPVKAGGRSTLASRIQAFELGNNSNSSLDYTAGALNFEKERQVILEHRKGAVPQIVSKFNDQVKANEEAFKKFLEEKQDRKKRFRARRKMRSKPSSSKAAAATAARKQKGHKKHHPGNSVSVWRNKRAGPTLAVDPKTFKPPKNLKPNPSQTKLIKKAMDNGVLFPGVTASSKEPLESLLHAFEPVELGPGEKIAENDDYFYVVEEGDVDIQVGGVTVDTVKAGDTFGEINLLYNQNTVGGPNVDSNDNKKTPVIVSTHDGAPTKLLRLKQKDYRGILQAQSKQDDNDKEDLLKKIPFMSKLMFAKDTDQKKKTKEDLSRLTSLMKPCHLKPGEQLSADKDDEMLYVVKDGNVKLTSDKNEDFMLGPGDFIGKKALMGSGGKEPNVAHLEALDGATIYSVAKKDVDKVLGTNYLSRETSKLDDKKKLGLFQCIKKVNLNPATLNTLADSIDDTTFLGGSKVLKQGTKVEPCLYFVREGSVTLTTDDGKFNQKVGPGGYFGVEQLLIPNKTAKQRSQNLENVLLSAEWNVTVSGSKPCVCGVLSLMETQEFLDNGKKPKEKELVLEIKKSPIISEREARRKSVQTDVTLDDLEMISVLGEGEFGEVWLVGAKVDNKKENFALKVLSKEKSDMDAIRREISVTQSFQHPFIVDLVKTYDTEESMYLLMGLVSGCELWEVIHSEDADGNWTSGIPESQAKFYALLLADTLAYIHSQQVVYRDLKPENVMIDKEGFPVLVDFGFAKKCPDKTYTACGTPNYVAPEIIQNTGHNAAVDYWALGVLVYEMVSGENPFYADGMENMVLFEAIMTEKHCPLAKGVTAAVNDLVDKLLEKNPWQRLGMLAGKEQDVLNHKWFKGMDVAKLRSRKSKAPWIPPRGIL